VRPNLDTEREGSKKTGAQAKHRNFVGSVKKPRLVKGVADCPARRRGKESPDLQLQTERGEGAIGEVCQDVTIGWRWELLADLSSEGGRADNLFAERGNSAATPTRNFPHRRETDRG